MSFNQIKSTLILDAYRGMGRLHKHNDDVWFWLGKNYSIAYWYSAMFFFNAYTFLLNVIRKWNLFFESKWNQSHLISIFIQFRGIPQKVKLLKSEPKNVLLWYSFQMPTFARKPNWNAFFWIIWFPQSKKKIIRIYIAYEWRVQFPTFWCFFFFRIQIDRINRIYFNLYWTWIELISKLKYSSFNTKSFIAQKLVRAGWIYSAIVGPMYSVITRAHISFSFKSH